MFYAMDVNQIGVNMSVIEEKIKSFIGKIPADLDFLKKDMEKHLRNLITDICDNMNLITNEEFNTQKNVLAKTREKLESLEAELKQYEHKKPQK